MLKSSDILHLSHLSPKPVVCKYDTQRMKIHLGARVAVCIEEIEGVEKVQ